jgi:hypothetical protein
MAMTLNLRSMLLAAALAAFPLAGAVAQAVDTGKSTGPSSTTAGANKTGDAKNDGTAMKSTEPGYQDKSDVGSVGKSPGNAAATGQPEKK